MERVVKSPQAFYKWPMKGGIGRFNLLGSIIFFWVSILAGWMVDGAKAAVVFNQMPATLELSYTSYAFSANHVRMFGNYVQLGGSERYLNTVTVTMVTWAKQSDFQSSSEYQNPAGWNHSIEAVMYAVDNTSAGPVLNYVTSSTREVLVPWRPTVVPVGYAETAGSPYPYNGYAFNVTFQFDGMVQVPHQLVVAVDFDTSQSGFQPKGALGPYDKLNVATGLLTPSVGTDLSPMVFLDQKTGNQSVATLNGNLGGNSPLLSMSASATSAFDQWQQTNGMAGASSAPDADPDHDGLSNIQEFLYGTSPTNGGSSNPIVVEPASEPDKVTAGFVLRVGFTPQVKVFTNLGDPSSSVIPNYTLRPVSPQPSGLPTSYVKYEVILDTSKGERGFIRVDVETNNP
ncbi:MAG: hypothetical protein EBS59_05950 [Verrucomicrobia bacterium]|nr:hypothetical protein [Verrucomicrobiota bacterium]